MEGTKTKLNLLLLITLILISVFTACEADGIELASKAVSNPIEESLLEQLEDKYGVAFEITHYDHTGGSIGSTYSYYVKSANYPFEDHVSVFDKADGNEQLNEFYGHAAFRWESNKFLENYFSFINKGNTIYAEGSIRREDNRIYSENTYDLVASSFRNTYLAGERMVNDGYISLYYFANRDDQDYTELNEILWQYAKLFKSKTGDDMFINIIVFDVQALESEVYLKYKEKEISLKTLEYELQKVGYLIKNTCGYHEVDLSLIDDAADIKGYLLLD